MDAHSGVVGGGAPNPIAGLARVLAACFDASTGRILVPGVRDGVVPVSDAEMDLYVRSGFDVERFRSTYGFRRLMASDPRELLRRLWTEPTFEVHGISGGYQGPGIKSIVPAWAEAKVSLRLVPGQSPARVVESIQRFVAEVDPLVEVVPLGSAPAFVTSVDAPECKAMDRAAERVLGKGLALTRGGGSIPAVATMAEVLRAPVLLMGLSLPEHGYHAPNEFFDWTQARRGVELYSAWFEELERLPARGLSRRAHSAPSAMTGSTWVARRTGSTVASTAARASIVAAASQRERVRRAHAVEEPREHPGCGERGDEARGQTGAHHPRALAHHEPGDPSRVRADGHPDANLLRALPHRVGHHAVEAHRGEHQGEDGEGRHQDQREPPGGHRGGEDRLQRPGTEDRNARVDRLERSLRGPAQLGERGGRAHHVAHALGGLLRVGEVHDRHHRLVEPELAHVADHAHHGGPVGRRRAEG